MRWVAGAPVSKDDFAGSEEELCRPLIRDMEEHFSQRFGVPGKIQTYFQLCEASTQGRHLILLGLGPRRALGAAVVPPNVAAASSYPCSR